VIKYLGSKRLLLPAIVAAVRSLEPARVLDLFSGTSRVGHALKATGLSVVANDHLAYAATLARCYVQADALRWDEEARALIDTLAKTPAEPGWFTETFCVRSRFFKPENGARIDAIREHIARLDLHPELEAIALVSLMEAADRVDSTTGVQMAYLKAWARRAENPLTLRMPAILPGQGLALHLDAADAAETEASVAYLDPPYNQHRYVGNYHVWESLVCWDKPEVEGVACKRVSARGVKSDFNSKVRIEAAFEEVVRRVRAEELVVSFSDEGYLSRQAIERCLGSRGHDAIATFDFPRYVGARIGVYNPKGEKVGRVSHVRNNEMLFCVAKSRMRAERAARAAEDAMRGGRMLPVEALALAE
jgi:adenine-specific DNA-methyltransferase